LIFETFIGTGTKQKIENFSGEKQEAYSCGYSSVDLK